MKNTAAFALILSSVLVSAGSGAAQAPPTAAPPLGKFVGPMLYVTDMQKSLGFYRDALGMQVRGRFHDPAKPDISLAFGADASQPTIMLLNDKAATPRKVEHPHGFERLVLTIYDLDAMLGRLRAAGYTPSSIRKVDGVTIMAMVQDPDGYRLELVTAKLPK
jgi:lactoylglutathione lyase